MTTKIQPTKGLANVTDQELIAEVERRYKTLPLFVGEFTETIACEDCRGRTWVRISDTPDMSEHACKVVADAAKCHTLTGLTPSELAERVKVLEKACNAVLANGRGRSGGSVYMVNKDEWLAFKAALNPAGGGK